MGQLCCKPSVANNEEIVAENFKEPDDKVDWHARAEAAKKKAADTKQISEEAFEAGVTKILTLAVTGYPDAFQSTNGKRNHLLQDAKGNQDAATDAAMGRSKLFEDVAMPKADLSVKGVVKGAQGGAELAKQAAATGLSDDTKNKMKNEVKNTMREEAKMTLLSMIPGVGLPVTLIYPVWKRLRKMCAVAAVNGWDLSQEKAKAEILLLFTTGEKGIQGEASVSKAVACLWKAFAGPLAILPVDSLIGAVNDAEGKADENMEMAIKAQRVRVSEAEYMQQLDPVPDMESYKRLARQGGGAFMDLAMRAGWQALEGGRSAASAAAAAATPHAQAMGRHASNLAGSAASAGAGALSMLQKK